MTVQLSVLLLTDGAVELLPASTCYTEVLEQGPFYRAKISKSWEIHWSSASYHLLDVNEYATSLVGHQVKGDACLVSVPYAGSIDALLSQASSVSSPTIGQGWPTAGGKPHQRSSEKISHGNKQALAAYLARQAVRGARRLDHSPGCRTRLQQPGTPPLPVPAAPRQTSAAPAAAAPMATPSAGSAAATRVAGKRPRSVPRVNSVHKMQHILHSRNCWPGQAGDEDTAAGSGAAGAHDAAAGAALPEQEQEQEQQSGAAASAAVGPQEEEAMFVMEDVTQAAAQQQQQQRNTMLLEDAAAAGAMPCAQQPQERQQAPGEPASTTHITELADDDITHVAHHLAATVSDVTSLANACRSFRRAIGGCQALLRQLHFTTDPQRPFKQAPCQHRPAWRPLAGYRRLGNYPLLLRNAAAAGNLSAQLALARLLDAAGSSEAAMKQWRAAAKAGECEGQLRYGLALYKGEAGCMQDAEDAHLWLTRAMKQAQAPAASGVQPSLAQKVLAEACLILGYQFFDGEGCRNSREDALRCFKASAASGSKEAEEVLGWMFNTGQY